MDLAICGSFLSVKRRHFQVKSGICAQENMLGVSFKQRKTPAHKQGQWNIGELRAALP